MSERVQAMARLEDGRDLFYVLERGREDGPLVVFEAGLGGSRSYWARVQKELAGELTTVAYDRSGLGRSPAAKGPRGLEQLATDLNALLDVLLSAKSAKNEREVILVGHSWGGPITRVAAAQRPGRVAGLVLVDPTDEACDLYFSPAARRLEKVAMALSWVMARTGLNRLTAKSFLAMLPDEAREEVRAEGFTVATAATYRAELAWLSRDLFALREKTPDLKGVSTTVISAGLTSPGINAERLAALQAAHRERARQTGGRLVLAKSSGHFVPLTQPEVVAGEVQNLAFKAKSK
jgi:pimeloyl-ACP methyl ester carboxylesterase